MCISAALLVRDSTNEGAITDFWVSDNYSEYGMIDNFRGGPALIFSVEGSIGLCLYSVRSKVEITLFLSTFRSHSELNTILS